MSQHILKAAQQLVEAVEKTKLFVEGVNEILDKHLPEELAGIVKVHSAGAAAAGIGAGWIPGAGGLAAVGISAGFIWTMYGRINARIHLPFSENVVKSLASGVATNLASSMVGGLIISTAFSMFPGIGSVAASGVVGATCYALTVGSAYVYMKLLTKLFLRGADPSQMDAKTLRREAKTVASQENVKEVLSHARQTYRPGK